MALARIETHGGWMFSDGYSTPPIDPIENARLALAYYRQQEGRMPRLVIFPDVSGEHRWRTEADNNRITGSSGQGFGDRTDAIRGFHDHVVSVYGVLAGGTAVSDDVINQIDQVFADDNLLIVFEGYTEDGEIDLAYMPEDWSPEEGAAEVEPTPTPEDEPVPPTPKGEAATGEVDAAQPITPLKDGEPAPEHQRSLEQEEARS